MTYYAEDKQANEEKLKLYLEKLLELALKPELKKSPKYNELAFNLFPLIAKLEQEVYAIYFFIEAIRFHNPQAQESMITELTLAYCNSLFQTRLLVESAPYAIQFSIFNLFPVRFNLLQACVNNFSMEVSKSMTHELSVSDIRILCHAYNTVLLFIEDIQPKNLGKVIIAQDKLDVLLQLLNLYREEVSGLEVINLLEAVLANCENHQVSLRDKLNHSLGKEYLWIKQSEEAMGYFKKVSGYENHLIFAEAKLELGDYYFAKHTEYSSANFNEAQAAMAQKYYQKAYDYYQAALHIYTELEPQAREALHDKINIIESKLNSAQPSDIENNQDRMQNLTL